MTSGSRATVVSLGEKTPTDDDIERFVNEVRDVMDRHPRFCVGLAIVEANTINPTLYTHGNMDRAALRSLFSLVAARLGQFEKMN